MNSKPISIYIHIPFCKTRCGYCDFLTFACNDNMYEPYKNALIKEIRANTALKNYTINSIFIGGGTPTILPPSFILEILEAVATFNISKNAEITIEANPGTLSLSYLRALRESGINRLSIGLQAWQNSLLKKIGRNHNLHDFLKNYNRARRLGFNNINVDLIFSLPYIKTEKKAFKYWVDTVRNVVSLYPEHISVYSLIIEEKTPFFREYEKGNLIPQSQEADRHMYHFAIKYLQKKGYNHYEISNFATKNKECYHNLAYWQRKEYISFGLGAHSFINSNRTRNLSNLKNYLTILKNEDYFSIQIIEETTPITKKDAMEEFMYLGLRCIKGISILDFEREFKTNIYNVFSEPIKNNLDKGLLEINNNRIYLTNYGLDISNMVMSQFLL